MWTFVHVCLMHAYACKPSVEVKGGEKGAVFVEGGWGDPE